MLSLRRILPVGIVFGSLVLPGCESDRPEAGAAPAAAVPAIKEVPGIHHYRRWSDHVAQGGQPEGDKAFQALKAEGITTVISVDGAMPDVDAAQRLGLTYVHVPIGYDGISKDEEARIVKAVQQSKGPVFVHCHHGLHRGPAAAALARITLDGISNESAVAGLKASGCSPAYDGLFRDVLFFSVPSEQALATVGPLPAAIKPEGVRDAMVHISDRFDYVKASQADHWAQLPQFPDVSPAHEATMLREGFRELARTPEAQAMADDFKAWLTQSEEQAAQLEAALRVSDLAAADAAYTFLKGACTACHAAYRDRE
jgi:protein tyrosine phosphatase (PTP) superfamily phosphohydrolase (DUF442 family)/cytochrome c556